MTGEEVLRSLAEDCARDVQSARSEYKQQVMLSARPFLTGAMIALARADAFAEDTDPQLLLAELLAPIQQPLVDAGVIELVRFGFEARTTAKLTPPSEEEAEQ